jgi:hypothetical protein
MSAYGEGTYGAAYYGSTATVGAYTGRAVIEAAHASDTWLLGEVVPLRWYVTDEDGEPVNATTSALTVIRQGAVEETVALLNPEVGTYEALYRPAVTGPYLSRLTLDGAYAGVAEDRWLVSPVDPAYLTVPQLRAYLGDTSVDDAEIAQALLAERYAQAARCRIDPYTPDLLEALKRRVARNLAARSVPVASFTSFEGGVTSTRLSARDAEVSRLEGPYRRRTVA